jgi:hypothetical protein
MARSKPNKLFKSSHTKQIEEQNKQNKTDTTSNVTPRAKKQARGQHELKNDRRKEI